ncbi:unnamed protein product [Microthlaspi erraticum]|uniref:Auxin-responsive protein n=1 Tax=Microthlaspi erraticum TaxID=1685480 RepID=A0A6D2IDC5_9BRAS|nr:unnamed protein product [Microthlaspi erraticum]
MELNLCLGLPGGGEKAAAAVAGNKRAYSETVDLKLNLNNEREKKSKEVSLVSNDNTSSVCSKDPAKPPAKAQVVGWPPVRSYRKNVMVSAEATFVKVSMDGAPYLRKIDLKMYKSYVDLSNALDTMFSSFTMGNNNKGEEGMKDFMKERKLMDSSEYVPSYEDKDGDWMLVGDVPWEMFVGSCKRIRIMKGFQAIGTVP